VGTDGRIILKSLDVGTAGRIIFKSLGRCGHRREDNIQKGLKDSTERYELNSSGSDYGPVADSCAHGNLSE